MSIKKEIQQIIKEGLTNIDIDESLENIVIEIPKKEEFGNYSTNIALILAKKLRESPIEIATKIKENIKNDIFEDIEIAPPGFINFYLKNHTSHLFPALLLHLLWLSSPQLKPLLKLYSLLRPRLEFVKKYLLL